jgi:hypothetical protein
MDAQGFLSTVAEEVNLALKLQPLKLQTLKPEYRMPEWGRGSNPKSSQPATEAGTRCVTREKFTPYTLNP